MKRSKPGVLGDVVFYYAMKPFLGLAVIVYSGFAGSLALGIGSAAFGLVEVAGTGWRTAIMEPTRPTN